MAGQTMSDVIRIIRSNTADFRRTFESLRAPHADNQRRAEDAAAAIVAAVRKRGDAAVIAYTKQFDGVTLTAATLQVPEPDLVAAEAALPAKVRNALKLAARRIRAFHAKQRLASWRYRDEAG